MKHLLVIANLHHASPRIPALLAYLAEHDWRATVVTPPLGAEAESVLGLPDGFLERVEIAVAPYRGDIFWFWRKVLGVLGFSSQSSYTEQIKERVGTGKRGTVDRLMLAYQTLFAIPDTEWPWRRSALRMAHTLIAERRFDAILSSSPFPTVHCVASRLKRRHGIPWVADLRDLWSQNHNYPFPEARRRLDRWLEVRTLRSADLLTTISLPLADRLESLHGNRVAVVRNGYQPRSSALPETLPERFTISYTGTIYAGKQNPDRILAALRHLFESGQMDRSRVALNFYGRHDSALQETIAKMGLAEVVRQHGMLPRAETRQRQRCSHLLLFLQWEDPDEQGIFPLKLYEYLDAGRPILATGATGSDEIKDMLAETCAGTTALTSSDIEQALLAAYRSFLADGTVPYHGIPQAIDHYSYSGCALQLANHLAQISPPAGQP
ncbi:MAG: glycosyltransferase [Pseudomonadota bacterium]|nr:glycosyltransferase [Pseudomonadota bacterium]